MNFMAYFYNGFELDAEFVSSPLSKGLNIIALKTKKKKKVLSSENIYFETFFQNSWSGYPSRIKMEMTRKICAKIFAVWFTICIFAGHY